MERTIYWNSSSTPVINLDLFQAAESPTKTEKNNADITGIICGIVSSKTTSGNYFSPSTSGLIFKFGKMPYPAPVAKNAAPIEET